MSAIASSAPPDARSACVLDFEGVRRTLVQRFPLLLIDRVLLLEPGERIVALKNVTGNELHFVGHFPDHAVMPGVLIVESMAQAVLLLDLLSEEAGAAPAERYLTNINVTFKRPVVPGDRLEITGQVIKRVSRGMVVRVHAAVDGAIAASGELVVARPSNDSAAAGR